MTIIYVAIALLVVGVVFMFNSLVRARNRVEESWSDIEVQLKRRYDLIPNIVGAVKGYMTHERGVFEKVSEARSAAMGAKNAHEKAEAENMLSSTLKTLFAVSENYPDLKANANFLDLQRELADTENKIQAARRFYNTTVMDFNNKIEMFPSNVLANLFRFTKREFFDIDEKALGEAPKISF